MIDNKKENIILAYFDVLGSKEKLNQLGLKQYLKIYEQLRKLIIKGRGRLVLDAAVNPRLNEDGSITTSTAMYSFDADSAFFSDSIVFWVNFDFIRLKNFCQLCSEFFCEVLYLGTPMRGGIAVGEACMDKRKKIFVGEPLIEAVQVEHSQEWLGVSFGKSFDKKPFKYLLLDPNSNTLYFKKHQKPGYSKNIPGYVLDWASQWNKMYKKSLHKHLSELNINSQFSSYYDNTTKFINLSQNNKDESIDELIKHIKNG